MADRTFNHNDSMAAERDSSMNATPKIISKGTLLMLAVVIVFITIFSIIFGYFMSAPTGGEVNQPQTGSSPGGSDPRAKP